MKTWAVEISHTFLIEMEDEWTPESRYSQDDILESLPSSNTGAITDDQLVFQVSNTDPHSDAFLDARQAALNARMKNALLSVMGEEVARGLAPRLFDGS